MPKGFEVLSLDDPIHIPSVLDELITSPDKFLNTSRRLKRACADSIGTLTTRRRQERRLRSRFAFFQSL